MDLKIYPGKLQGAVNAIPSKSQAHRLLICSAFSNKATMLVCSESNQDIDATVRCLNAIGADISRTKDGFLIHPVADIPCSAVLDCGESGSTLRFLLPIVCALGIDAVIKMSGRLPYRPLSPLWEELERMGCQLSRPTDTTIHVSGELQPGTYVIAGNVSSQYITGLLFALSLMQGESEIKILGKLESKPYVDLTLLALAKFGVKVRDYRVGGTFPFTSPGKVCVEGDWSNGAFFLTAKALGNNLKITGLDDESPQGDRAIMHLLNSAIAMPTIDAANIPDLIPILAVYFATRSGARFTNIARLRLKESDRVQAIADMLVNLGGEVQFDENTLVINGTKLHGGIVDAQNDHRIAMSAAIAATVTDGEVIIIGAECVAKSYPDFWNVYKQLGGIYEQYIR